tara:strand:- start:386 stop:487 length:102 start_codon:yes stop_codon:yes gene_type:complete
MNGIEMEVKVMIVIIIAAIIVSIWEKWKKDNNA